MDVNVKAKQVKKDKKSSTKQMPKEISIFTIIFILIIIAVCVGIYFGIRYIVLTAKYKEYTDKMVSYGYNELYDNKKATATQTLTNAELLKVVIGAMKNNNSISNLYYLANNNDEYQNWYEYSIYTGVNNVILQSELNNKASLIDAIMFTVSCIETFEEQNIELTQLEMSEKSLSKYSIDEQELLSKAVTLGLIKNKTSSLSKSNVIKGELNKLVINAVEKYATMHYKTTTVNNKGEVVRQEVNIVTDKDKLPQNYKDYPYIIDSIDNEVYEYDYNIVTQSKFTTPKETYKIMGYLNGQTDNLIQRYFSKILNVDYRTISTEGFLEGISNDVVYKLNNQDVQEYVNYVKQYKIRLQGSATPLLPIMYNNGEQYVVRTKITFKVLSSDTEYNLLFGDQNGKVKYNSNEITVYVDVPTGMTLNARSLLVYVSTLANHIVNPNTVVKVEE